MPKPANKVSQVLSQIRTPAKRTGPLWKGPQVDGITYSMLCGFLSCRERFRLKVIEGLRANDQFNHRMEYGQMWHVCEEAHAHATPTNRWELKLKEYCQGLLQRYTTSQEQIAHWYEVCKTQFPVYMDYWSKHKDVVSREPLFQEQVFDVPYELPSGRNVRLRGKWDSVDLIGGGKKGRGVYLQENKTKGDIDEVQIKRQLTFDLQTMLYLTALTQEQERLDDSTIKRKLSYQSGKWRLALPVKGVRYNVVRRPLSGGKGTIKQKQGESRIEYYARLKEYIVNEPETYFMRWTVDILPVDILKFRQCCLDPLLEQVCGWYEWMVALEDDPFAQQSHHGGIHWRHPFGVRNILDEGGSTDLDEYLTNKSEVGLQRVDKLFTELE
jgi:hypothetical protein